MAGGLHGSERLPCGLANPFRRALREKTNRVEVPPQPDMGADGAASVAEVHSVIQLQHIGAGGCHARQNRRGIAADVQ